MVVRILEDTQPDWTAYAAVPIAFDVTKRFRPEPMDAGIGGIRLVEEPVVPSYRKDYDVAEVPAQWATRWNVQPWGVFAALDGAERVGGAVVAWGTPALDLLKGRDDVAALWDLRVDTAYRRQGVGAALFTAAVQWARARGCVGMTVETQNINVPACRFYARQGCVLRGINPWAYPELPEEIQFLWYREL